MARIRKVNSKFSRTKAEQTLTAGVDEMFGDGSDGDVTITSGQTVYLSNDMYYENLTVQSGAVLFTNGFRIFVNDTLTNNGTIGMPSNLLQTANSSTISGRSDTTKTYRWGEGSSGSTISQADLNIAIEGYLVTADGSVHAVAGGDPGTVPVDTVTDPTDGESGQPGNPGTKPFAQPGDPGGPGNPGAPGNPGTASTAGVAGTVGKGGGIILLVAKNIAGSGSIESFGRTSSAGNPGTDGPDGTPGAPGNPAPDQPSFANQGSPYPAGVNAGASTIPASTHPHPARTNVTSPLSSVTGNLTHNANVTGGTYNPGTHSHGDVYHEDDIFDPITGSPFPTNGTKFNARINTGEHSHPQKGSLNVPAPSSPVTLFSNSPTYPPGQTTPSPAPDSNVITTHSATYTPAYYNTGYYHHGSGPTSPTYNPSTLHHGNTHVIDSNSPAIVQRPGHPHKGNITPDHSPHTAFDSNHVLHPNKSPDAPFPASTNANTFSNPHNAPVTSYGGVNAGNHSHPADSPWSNQPNANKATIDSFGPHPANKVAHNAVVTNHHNAGNYPAGHPSGSHHHGAGSHGPNPKNSNATHHHNHGHHQGNPGHHPHGAGSHGPNPKNSNSYNRHNPGNHPHVAGGTGPNPKNSTSQAVSHNAGYHRHAIYYGHPSNAPFYPRDKHNHNANQSYDPKTSSHYHNHGNHPHGAGSSGPPAHNGNTYNHHNAGTHPHVGYVGHPSNAPFYPRTNHNHNANYHSTHNAGNHPYHNPHGSHNAGSHAPNPTSNHNHNANTANSHNLGSHPHPSGATPHLTRVPANIAPVGHDTNPGGQSIGHNALPHPSGSHNAFSPDNSPAVVNANSSVNPPAHTSGSHAHSAAPHSGFNALPPGPSGSGGWLQLYSIPVGHSNTSGQGHTANPKYTSYGAGNAGVPTHHSAGTHYHPSGPQSATSLQYLFHIGTANPSIGSNEHSNASLNKGYWPAGTHTHATGPVSPLNDPTAITATGLGEFDFYGPGGAAVGHVGAGNHTGTYRPQGHNPGQHTTNRLAHNVGKAQPITSAAHALQTTPVNSPAYINLARPSLPANDQEAFALSGSSQNPFSHGTGSHDIASYVQPHGTGGELPAHGHTGTPYPAGHNTSFENLPYTGGTGGAGGAGGVGGDVTTTGSTNPGSTGGIVVVTQDPGNVQNQIGHSNFAKIINID